jgi:hypothetical protein
MKKTITILLIIACNIVSCFGQVNEEIIHYYRQKGYISFEEVLFTPIEFIELCKDSVGIRKFESEILREQKLNSTRTPDEIIENNLLLSLVKESVLNVSLNDSYSQISKNNIIKKLAVFEFNNESIDEDFIKRRLKAKEEVEFCNRCLSMFIFFICNPTLYSQVIKNNNSLFPYNIYFPLNMLQDRNTPIELLKMRKSKLLSLINSSEDEVLKQIFIQISKCDITDRGN